MKVKVVRAGNPRLVDPSLYGHTLEGKLQELYDKTGRKTTYA